MQVTDFKKDNFLAYILFFIFPVLITANGFIFGFHGVLLTFLACIVLFGLWLNLAYDKAIKLYLPAYLDGRIRFSFYVIDGSQMISPEELMKRRIESG